MSTPRRASAHPIGTGSDVGTPADRYDRMLRLASLFDDSGEEMRDRATLGEAILEDPAFTESVPLAPATAGVAEEEILAATSGRHGLLTRSIELDADALVLRATVLTYRWIDELRSAAELALGSIAARAIGYLAPQVALGGAIVSAGLIETDALDRDGVAAYLGELAEANPDLMEHLTSGGGGLLDSLRMRSLLTAAALSGDQGRVAGQGGLRAIGVSPLGTDFGAALRDVAAALVEPETTAPEPALDDGSAPRNLTDLMTQLEGARSAVEVRRVAESRYVVYLPGPAAGPGRRLRLVDGDSTAYAGLVVRSVTAAVADDPAPRLLLVGAAQGGVTAAQVAAAAGPDDRFVIDQVVTAGAPSAHVPRIPEATRVLSLEDRSDPVALLGSLINADVANRVTVVFDGSPDEGESLGVTGGRAADAATHPQLRAEIDRMRELGFLAG